MRKILIAISAITATLCADIQAQEAWEAHRLTGDRFFYGSKNLQASTTSEALINDYGLDNPGTLERISQWLEANPVHPDNTRLKVMKANLLVRQHNYSEAFSIYNSLSPEQTDNLPEFEKVEAQLYGAVAYIETGDYLTAQQKLDDIKESPYHSEDITYYSAYTKYAQGDYATAASQFSQVSGSKRYRSTAPVYLADCYLLTGQPQAALNTLQGWTAASDGDKRLADEAKRISGEASYDLGRYDEAVETLSAYDSSADTSKRTALYKLGMSLFRTRQFPEAAKTLSRSAGTASDVMAQSAWLNAGKAYIATGNKKQAGIAFQLAANMTADSAVQEEAAYNYALTLHQGAEMGFGESVQAFEQFLNKYPGSRYSSTVAQHLSEVYFTTKNYNAALQSINRISHPSPDIIDAKQKVLYNIGIQHFANGDYNKAKQFMTESHATKTNPEAVFWKAEAEYRLGDLKSAATDYNYYLRDGRNTMNRALAYYGSAYILFKGRQYSKALGQFRSFISESQKAGGGERANLKADAYNRIGDCLFTQRDFNGAETAYRQSLSTHATHGDYSLLQLAIISGLRGDYAKKVELLSQLESSYTNSEYADNALFEQGRAYVLSGDSENALKSFRQLIDKYPSSTNTRRAMNEIAAIHKESGDTEAAINQYETVISKYKDTREAAEALESLKQIFTSQGRVNEYAAIAEKAGRALTTEEFDEMLENAAVMAKAEEDYIKAAQYYAQIEQQTMSEDTKAKALASGLECAEKAGDSTLTLYFADKILDSNSKVSPERISQAMLIRAHQKAQTGDTAGAADTYKRLSEDHVTVYGAQATVELCQILYNGGQYAEAESRLDKFIDEGTTYPYWLARAFILLSDVYSKTDRDIEAREYLLSLKNNYSENEEINQMINQRLNK